MAVDGHLVTSIHEVRELYGEPADGVLRKELDHLGMHCRALIAHSPFVVVSTASAAGRCDASPKGGPPGFVTVLENPHVGILFLVPGNGETLRVNGTAQLSRELSLLNRLATGGKPARLAVVVTVEQAYMHCAKAILRSGLWSPDEWPPADELPSGAEIMADHSRVGDRESSEAAIADSYANRL